MAQIIVYTVEEVAKLLRVSVDAIYDMLRSGELVGQKVGRAWRIEESELKRYMLEGPANKSAGEASENTDEWGIDFA